VARLALTAVAPVCFRVPEAEALLTGVAPTIEAVQAAANAAADQAKPIDDVRASATYRRAMVRVVTQRAIHQAVRRARKDRDREKDV
jgi:carbon-monoxide dehydrogenase medium subunit